MIQFAILVSVTALGAEGKLSEAEILRLADSRIHEHRTSEVVLKLLDDKGQSFGPGTEIVIEQTRHEFLFGSNIYALGRLRTPEDNKTYAKRFAELFNFATLPFYWWNYERQRGKPGHERTERILKFCLEHRITAKGHPLAWNYVDPPWIPADPGEAMDLQLQRIADCAARFRDRIMIWDVVNEATHYDRAHVRRQAPNLTRAIDEAGVGPYVRKAFRSAREASPRAILLINDYRLDADYEKRVLKELVSDKGEPLYDVIGLQSHQHGGAKPVTQLWENCERFAKYGKPLHWTENTFVSGKEGWDLARTQRGFKWLTTPEGERRQAVDVERFYTVLFSHPAVEAITWWDFSDQRAWQSAPAGLLRADMTPKPAYEKLHHLIKEKWWTRTKATVDAAGGVKFRGFRGEYRVETTSKDRRLRGEFTLTKRPAEPIEVRMGPRL